MLTKHPNSPSIAPRTNMISGRLISGAAILLATACTTSGTRVPEGGPNIGAPFRPWSQKSHDERQGFMAAHVEPTMKRLFMSFKPKSYSDFGCETCHGKDMDLLDYRMPNALYALPEKDTIAEATSYDEDTTKFMMEKVVPTFAKLLSESPKEPGTAGGVSCFTCHPHE
jgi:hypothetical protein